MHRVQGRLNLDELNDRLAMQNDLLVYTIDLYLFDYAKLTMELTDNEG